METYPYLLFELNDSQYGLDARVVREVFFLPEITPIAEAPRYIVGIFNLRGEIVPVMDLNLRLSYRAREYHLNHSLIVIVWESVCLGIIVDRVCEVTSILADDRTENLSYSYDNPHKHRFIQGVAQVQSGLIALLDCEALVREFPDLNALDSISPDLRDSMGDYREAPELDGDADSDVRELPVFCPNATPEEREVFRQRAAQLRIPDDTQNSQNLVSLAVVGFQGEYFGIDLKTVREFAEIRDVTPIPCCPPRIVGNMNLRGEILTLVAIDELLELPIPTRNSAQVLIVQVEDIVAGITVDEVFDVVQVSPTAISAIPTAVRSIHDEYLRGTALYKDKALTVLDMYKILTKGELVVEEEP
ncbi:MAG: purine-binding chemotaxis protein CheW [Cyanobacteria bacterium SID2]|nr:purine-binding chemotaxis protein CheW [Cyanobacteria bacterium SID2]MBP0002323.1 purine-binding chemotaxis protein CheW [Cyanobacteria bacterium SBC]